MGDGAGDAFDFLNRALAQALGKIVLWPPIVLGNRVIVENGSEIFVK
jgi:hypothetical protein